MAALKILADFWKEARAPLGFSICFFLYGHRPRRERVLAKEWSLDIYICTGHHLKASARGGKQQAGGLMQGLSLAAKKFLIS